MPAPFLGGWHWQALMLAGSEASLVVAGSVWLLGLAQRRLTGDGPLWAACRRSSYAAFVLQVPILLTLAIAARSLTWPAEAKAFLVAVLGVPASFWLGWATRPAPPGSDYPPEPVDRTPWQRNAGR